MAHDKTNPEIDRQKRQYIREQIYKAKQTVNAAIGIGDDTDLNFGSNDEFAVRYDSDAQEYQIENTTFSDVALKIDAASGVTVPNGDISDGTNTIYDQSNAKIGTDRVTSTSIASSAVGSDEIATDAVGSDEIGTDAVGSDEIGTDAVGSDEIGTDAVNSDEIAQNAVDSTHIGSGQVTSTEMDPDPFTYDPGMTEWADGLSNEEVARIALQTDETLEVERIEFRQKGGGSSTSASIDVRDTTAASTIGSQDLGGTTKNAGTSGTANTIIVRLTNSTGSAIDANPRVVGYINGA